MSERSMRRAYGRRVTRGGQGERRVGGRGRFAASATGALGATVLFAPAAKAETFTVTSLEDDGTGGTTLREAVVEANIDSDDDVIVFQSGLSGTIELVSPPLFIGTGGLDIQGPGAGVITVDADSDAERVFDLDDFTAPDTPVRIAGLTLTGGSPGNPGGAIMSTPGGGSAAELTIDGAVITGNESGDRGGGVYVDRGSLTITNSVISGNDSDDSGGGFFVGETDGDQQIEVRISDSVVSDNDADVDGGGARINNPYGETLIERSTFAGNTALYDGGGVFFSSPDAPVTIDASTFYGNSAADHPSDPIEPDAGAIRVGGFDHPFTLNSSTLSGNSADGLGGAIRINGHDSERMIRNSTIAGNTGYTAGGIYVDDDDPGSATLSSSIVADNSAPTGPDLGQSDPTSSGTFVSGFSLVESTSDATITETPAGSNIFGLDPQLGPLASNGGPTQTHLPALTSPVLERGIANGLATDQRGLVRTSDLALVANVAGSDATDIGAVEIQAGDVEAQCQATTVRRLAGTGGDDTVSGTDAPEALFGFAGDDTLDGGGGNDCVSGDEGNDHAKGGAGKDEVNGGAGKDRLAGNGGKDNLKGGAGKDNLKGGAGKDRLSGGGGKDKLSGGGGKDRLRGGPGKDRIKGGGGKDRINCGGGKDKVTVSANDKVSNNCEKVVEVR